MQRVEHTAVLRNALKYCKYLAYYDITCTNCKVLLCIVISNTPSGQHCVCEPDTMSSLHEMLHIRDQARGRIGRNSRPRGRNFAQNGTQGELGVSLKKIKKKKFFFFFFRETHLHSVTTQMQAVVTLSDNLLPLHHVSPSIKWQ